MFFEKFNYIIVFISLLLLFPCKVLSQTSNESPPSNEGDYPSSGKYHFSPAMSIIFVIIVVVFFVVGCFSVFARRCIESGNPGNGLLMMNEVNRRSRRTGQGLELKVIESFPTFLYSDVKKVKRNGALECAICLNEFKDEETLRLIPRCCHVFHPECIDTWLISHSTCPVCRADLVHVSGETGTNNCDFGSVDSEEDATTIYSPTRVDEGRGHVHEMKETIIEIDTSSHEKLTGKFPRSHTTGHSIIRPHNNYEKFTLRMPEDMQKRLMKPELRRAKSSLVFPSARSSKKGYRSSSVGPDLEIQYNNEQANYESHQDRWGFTTAPPFFTRSRSAQAPIYDNRIIISGSSSKSTKSSLDWLFGGTSSKDETGGRSSAIMGNNPV